jgi:hypothetical protein
MAKSPRVEFKFERVAEGDWRIEAKCAGAETQYINGFTTKAAVDEWMSGDGRLKWLRSQGYAK